MKKIFSLLSIIMLCFILVGCGKDEKENQKYIFLGKEYNSLKDIKEEDILEHVRLVSTLYTEVNKDSFTDEEITIITAFKLMMNGETATKDEVKVFVKDLFGKDNFEIKEGKYINPKPEGTNFKEIIINEVTNYYTSTLYGYGLSDPSNYFNNIEVKDDVVIVHYDYGYKYIEQEQNNTIIGEYNIYLKYKNESLIIDKITYEKKAN